MDIRARLGHRIRELRREAGLSQSDLAEAARLNRAFVGAVERGDQAASIDSLAKLATALGVEPHELLVGPAKERPNADAKGAFARRVLIAAEGASPDALEAFAQIARLYFAQVADVTKATKRGKRPSRG